MFIDQNHGVINLTQTPEAFVVSAKDRGRKSIKNSKNIYLKDGEEFQLELKNKTTEKILVRIKLDGVYITPTGLVLEKGQKFYLDCYPESKRKFLFKTYEVDIDLESLNSVKDNGKLEFEFYKEYKPYTTSIRSFTYTNFPTWTNDVYGNTYTNNLCNNIGTIEVGKTTEGEKSDTNFGVDYTQFCLLPFHTIQYLLLPNSKKPLETKEIVKENKKSSDKLELIQIIEKLSELEKSGIITHTEFNDKKKEILSRL